MIKSNKNRSWWLAGVIYLLCAGAASAQSFTEINTKMTINAGLGATELSQTLYIGPAADINVIGVWSIASEEVYISPSAVITGPGTIIFDQPSSYSVGGTPLSWTGQTVDGGGATISCQVMIRNSAGVSLDSVNVPGILGLSADATADITFAGALAFADTAADGSALSGNDLILNSSHSIFAGSGSVSNFAPGHFIVTNGTGTCAKDSLGAQGFIFPVGIAAGDYTPASLVNLGTADRYDVRAMPGIDPAYVASAGIGRTWDISETTPGGSNVILTLQHNYITGPGGPGTSGADYDNNNAFVSASRADTATWDTYTLTEGITPGSLTTGTPVPNATMLMRGDLVDFTSTTRYTKLSVISNTVLKAIKTAAPDSVYLGDTFSYHIVVVNAGPITQRSPVTVRDTLPGGAAYVSSSGIGWTISYNAGIVVAMYNDSLNVGDSASLNIYVQAASSNLNNVGYVGNVPSAPCDTCTPGTPTAPVVLHPQLLIPDAISPNGDGVNDYFVIVNVQYLYPKAAVAIYNRWGDQVWNSNGPYQNNFGGTGSDGDILPDGTYFYIIEFNDNSGRKESHFLNISRK